MQVTRDEAIRRLGVRYEVDALDLAVHEKLGGDTYRGDDLTRQYVGSTPEAACDIAANRAYEQAWGTVEKLSPLFAGSRNRFYLWCIHRGFAREAAAKRERVEKAWAKLKAAQSVLRDGVNVDVKWLPHTMVLPSPISVGSPVYVLKDLYLQEGIRFETDEITAWEVAETVRPGQICYVNIRFFTGNGHVFVHDATERPAEVCTNVMGQRLFLDRETALDAARASAERAYRGLAPWLPQNSQPEPV